MRKMIVLSFVFLGFFILSGAAHAEWMLAHGNVAEIENPANCTSKHFGWGLDITQNSGLSNWIHMPVPTKYGDGWGARYIKLVIFTGSVDAWVSDIHVYNGNTRVKQFTGLSYSNGWKTIQLDMGSKIIFNKGMGFAIKVNAGVEPMSHRIVFATAGANFTQ
ncbi:MAG: hypothetical protein WAW37_03090 [Syntrophobacteraceae bacterium]